MPSVTYDFVPNQVVWVVTGSGVKSGTVSRVEILATGAGVTVTYFIKLAGATTVTEFDETEVYANCQASEGYQTVNYSGGVASNSPAWSDSGSPLTALTATVTFDTVNVVNLSVSGASLTFQQVVNSINGQIGSYGVVTIEGGNLVFTSSTTGASSTVNIVDVDLFSSLNGFNYVDDAVDGNGSGAIEAYATSVCS